MNKKGSSYIYLIVMAMMFFGVLFYVLFSEVIGEAYGHFDTFINGTNNSFTSAAQETMGTIRLVWRGFILFFFFGLILWALMVASRQERY